MGQGQKYLVLSFKYAAARHTERKRQMKTPTGAMVLRTPPKSSEQRPESSEPRAVSRDQRAVNREQVLVALRFQVD